MPKNKNLNVPNPQSEGTDSFFTGGVSKGGDMGKIATTVNDSVERKEASKLFDTDLTKGAKFSAEPIGQPIKEKGKRKKGNFAQIAKEDVGFAQIPDQNAFKEKGVDVNSLQKVEPQSVGYASGEKIDKNLPVVGESLYHGGGLEQLNPDFIKSLPKNLQNPANEMVPVYMEAQEDFAAFKKELDNEYFPKRNSEGFLNEADLTQYKKNLNDYSSFTLNEAKKKHEAQKREREQQETAETRKQNIEDIRQKATDLENKLNSGESLTQQERDQLINYKDILKDEDFAAQLERSKQTWIKNKFGDVSTNKELASRAEKAWEDNRAKVQRQQAEENAIQTNQTRLNYSIDMWNDLANTTSDPATRQYALTQVKMKQAELDIDNKMREIGINVDDPKYDSVRRNMLAEEKAVIQAQQRGEKAAAQALLKKQQERMNKLRRILGYSNAAAKLASSLVLYGLIKKGRF